MLLIISMGLAVIGQTWAQSSTIDHEKATLVSKFAKYVTWPVEARQREFIIGVYKDVNKYNYFSNFFANKGVKGKDISVQLINTINDARGVNILYISSPNQRNSIKLTDRIIGDSNALIITENSKNIAKTMIDISYNKQQSKISFKVIEPNIVDAKLTMPELSYFSGSNNNEEILSESPTFTKKNQEEEKRLALENQLAQQQLSLQQLNEKLNLTKESSEKYHVQLQQQSERLKAVQEADAKKGQEINAKDKKLQELEKQLQSQQKQLQAQQTQLAANKQLQSQQIPLETNGQDLPASDQESTKEAEKAINELSEKLNKQTEIANNTAIKLANVTKDHKKLSSYQTLFYVFLMITIIALFIAFMMWKKANNSASQKSLPSEKSNDRLLSVREEQLIKSENIAAVGYIATDITYAVGLSLEDLQAQLESVDDTKSAAALKPVVDLLENFNLIAADQDDTKPQNIDVIAYIQKMLMLYNFEFSQSNIVYSYSGEKKLSIKTVPSYIALILLNLINNSIKHGFDNNGNGKIAIKVEKGIKSGAIITYSDDGKGMSRTTLEQVFKPFFTTRSDRGYVGVGMSTTYDLIKKKLAGDIKIDSKEGKGATVIITLP